MCTKEKRKHRRGDRRCVLGKKNKSKEFRKKRLLLIKVI
jgi:hypothetical protein